MKKIIYLFYLLPVLAQAQESDSLIVNKRIDSLLRVSIAHSNKAEFDQAMQVYSTAEKMAFERFGGESFPYGQALGVKARILYAQSNYPEAKELFVEGLAIIEKSRGKITNAYIGSLNNYGALLKEMGLLPEAEKVFLEVLQLREKFQGKENEVYVTNLVNIGGLYLNMGDFAKGESYLLEAWDIQRRVQKEETIIETSILENLAILYLMLENFSKSETFFQQSLATRAKLEGKLTYNYAEGISNFAVLYINKMDYQKAEALLLESLEITAQLEGKESSNYAQGLANLGNVYAGLKDFDKASQLYSESASVIEKAFGKAHPNYGICLQNLAGAYMEMNQESKAEPLLLESKAIQESALGKEHPDYAQISEQLAMFYANTGRHEKALPLYTELAELNRSILAKAVFYLSDLELQNYLSAFLNNQHSALTFAHLSLQQPEDLKQEIAGICFDNCLFYKGFLLDATHHIRRMALSDSVATGKFHSLARLENELASQYSMPVAERGNVVELENLCNEAKKDIARTVAGFEASQRQVKWQDVKQQLQPGEAAIEFVHYDRTGKIEGDSIFYAALLLRSGDAAPKFIRLFEEKTLDTLLNQHAQRRADYVHDLYAAKGARATSPMSQTSLYELIWQPLEKELAAGNINTIYFSPTGLLHRLNIGAIPSPGGVAYPTFADRYHLIQLGSTRQLVQKLSSTPAPKTTTALLFGGIQYEMDSTAIVKANLDYRTERVATSGELAFDMTDSTYRGGKWNHLKWTEKEVASIGEMLHTAGFQADVRLGYKATEEGFKSFGNLAMKNKNPAPRILHIATHGYFFPDPKTAASEKEPVFKISDHPMIRSGLILAGGNHAWQTGKPFRPDMEDGILTAYEISQMDLSNTELVVLSACETGLGDILGNEGVFGLQRAFKIAGAKHLIMSLWQVPDAKTQELMSAFYEKWLVEKMSLPDAFRAAQKEMREKYEHPFYWAGFVLVE